MSSHFRVPKKHPLSEPLTRCVNFRHWWIGTNNSLPLSFPTLCSCNLCFQVWSFSILTSARLARVNVGIRMVSESLSGCGILPLNFDFEWVILVNDKATGWATGLRFAVGPALRPTQPHTQWVPKVKRRGLTPRPPGPSLMPLNYHLQMLTWRYAN
jgi:hypothetical protein